MAKEINMYCGSNTVDEYYKYSTKSGEVRSVMSAVTSQALQTAFRVACRKTGLPASEVMRRLMRQFVEEAYINE